MHIDTQTLMIISLFAFLVALPNAWICDLVLQSFSYGVIANGLIFMVGAFAGVYYLIIHWQSTGVFYTRPDLVAIALEGGGFIAIISILLLRKIILWVFG